MRLTRVEREGERLVEARGNTRSGVPISPGKIVAVGLNFLDHIRETGVERPAQPLLFAKFPSSVVGDGAPIVIDPTGLSRI